MQWQISKERSLRNIVFCLPIRRKAPLLFSHSFEVNAEEEEQLLRALLRDPRSAERQMEEEGDRKEVILDIVAISRCKRWRFDAETIRHITDFP